MTSYQVRDFKNIILGNELLSLPFMSEDTKVSTKGDMLIFKLRIDLVKEKIFKKYVSRRVRFRIFLINIIIGRGTHRNVSKSDAL